jgi:hypothetical protein
MAEQRTPPPLGPPPSQPLLNKLSSEQVDYVIRWLHAKWTKPDCPWHGPTQWSVGDLVVGLPGFVPLTGPRPHGSSVYPMIVLTCQHCGYSVPINAIVMGFTQSPAPVQPEPVSA